MQVKTKKGTILNVAIVKPSGDIFGNDATTGKYIKINKDDILVILNDTLTLWDIIRGFVAKIKVLIGK